MTAPFRATALRSPSWLLPVLAAGLAGVLLAGCGKKDDAASATAAAGAAPPAKVLVVGTDAAYAPFESQDASGQIVGFDIDLVTAVAAKAGLQIKVVNTPWEGIFNTLAQGDRDIVISAVTITPERGAQMEFSAPYFDAQQLVAVPSTSRLSSFADLKGMKVGVQNGTTGDEVVSKLLGKTNAAISRFESTPLALKELEAGGLDAVVADNGVVIHYVANNPGGKFKTVADATAAVEHYGMAVAKGNKALQDKLNQGLAAVRADGSYTTLYARYFGAAAAGPASAASK